MTSSKLYNDTPYLPFEINENQKEADLNIPFKDVLVLRELGLKYAEIAALPIQKERIAAWKNLNDKKGGRPLIWINEVCWHEMDVDNELTFLCESELGLRLESYLRKTLYQWKHMRGDMVVEPVIDSPYIIENSGFGIRSLADVLETNKDSSIASRHFHNQITSIEDVNKIKMPVISHKAERTEEFFECYQSIFKGILPVRKKGCSGFWYAPWDDIVLFMGAENVLINLIDDPDLMHALIDRLTTAYNAALDQYNDLGLISSNNCNTRVGSGAYGYTNELKADDGTSCTPNEIWGNATPQIFASVSKEMHKEFGITYESRWLSRFGLNYYGCCEPLHNRIDILSEIPNLRKISISPWADVNVAANNIGEKFVVSLKPSSVLIAKPNFDENSVRAELSSKFAAMKNCSVEVILKDISTVQNKPERLWRWAEIAMEEAKKYE
jgi:hypothetical protein